MEAFICNNLKSAVWFLNTVKEENYENTGRKKAAGKNIRKSETIVSLPTCACSNAS